MNKPFEIGDIIYAKQNVEMKSTAGYNGSLLWTMKQGTSARVAVFHSVNGLIYGLKDENGGEWFKGAWTNEFDKFTKDKPIECENCEIYKERIKYLENNPIIKRS